jgi:hypothetical protein
MWFLRMDKSIVSADEFLDRTMDLESAIAEHLQTAHMCRYGRVWPSSSGAAQA